MVSGNEKYVGENITFLHEWMEEYIPQIKVTRTEGTYLVWMDFRGLGIAEENLKDFVENRAGLWLDGGKCSESQEADSRGSMWHAPERRWKRL